MEKLTWTIQAYRNQQVHLTFDSPLFLQIQVLLHQNCWADQQMKSLSQFLNVKTQLHRWSRMTSHLILKSLDRAKYFCKTFHLMCLWLSLSFLMKCNALSLKLETSPLTWFSNSHSYKAGQIDKILLRLSHYFPWSHLHHPHQGCSLISHQQIARCIMIFALSLYDYC